MPFSRQYSLLLLLLAVIAAAVFLPSRLSAQASGDHFEKKIRPLLAAHCWKCHGADKAKGGLRLDSAAALAKGGNAGPVVVPGQPNASQLLLAVEYAGDLRMPPVGKLKDQEIADLATWIKAGAIWPGGSVVSAGGLAERKFTSEQKAFWAFQPVAEVAPPIIENLAAAKSPIDRFIVAKLEATGLAPAPVADKRTLLRRASFDMTGLPPTPNEIDTFLADVSPDAFTKVIDRLLASPHYGEHWGRHWLDVVRYAETTANDANAVMRYAYRYRDYVVASFNKDKPYDQFIVEQLAGDLLPSSTNVDDATERVIATGFLMIGPKALAETDKEESRLDIVDDQIDVTGRAFLGLTVSCARCHDHKFDPIPTADYYALAGIFRGTDVFRDEVRNATMWHEWPLGQRPGEQPLFVMAPKEGTPRDLKIHLRGSHHHLGAVAPRGFLRIISDGNSSKLRTSRSGRLELARWIAAKENPLTARVMVNRVWQHHFGSGLVATSDNFGFRGERPTHPELLDWLATRFVANGWSVKALHRSILQSSVYQTSSRADDLSPRADPNNGLLWRMPRRRLEAESVRDGLLVASGRLDRTVGGNEASEFLFREGEVIDRARDFLRPNQVKSDHGYYTTSVRRSLYLPVVRNALPDVLSLFDAADPNGLTAVRNDTTVASQALFLLNHPFVREQAKHFAGRLLSEASATDEDRIRDAYRIALARSPEPSETVDARQFLAHYATLAATKGRSSAEARTTAWQSFCQTLLCGNEFLYVD